MSATPSGPASWPRSPGASAEEHAAQVGCVLAAYVVETVGPQDYTFTAEQFLARLDESYGGDAAEAVASAPARRSAEPATR